MKTAQQIMNMQSAFLTESHEKIWSSRPKGTPRAHWYALKKHTLGNKPVVLRVKDTSLKSQPKRILCFNNSQKYDLWVTNWGSGNVMERIDLRQESADAVLAKFEMLNK